MVGVPGKFKGCETCRLRRVRCDNGKPACKKCVDTSRACVYERDRTFIIATEEDGGRCSSHPPRVVKPKKGKDKDKDKDSEKGKASSSKASSKSPTTTSKSSPSSSKHGKSKSKSSSSTPPVHPGSALVPMPVPLPPVQPAWEGLMAITNHGANYQIQAAALSTSLGMLNCLDDEDPARGFTFVSFAPYATAEVRPLFNDEEFELQAHCMIHLAQDNDEPGVLPDPSGTDSICMFLYEQNLSGEFGQLPPEKKPNSVKSLGPKHFRTFPNHHFFARVYRPNAIWSSLITRKPTFLSGPEWTTTPWEVHPKSWLDKLFDLMVLLPPLFCQADRIVPQEQATLNRRLMAQDLLANCLNVERLLENWHRTINPAHDDPTQPPSFWIEDPTNQSGAVIPFADALAFRDSVTALMFIYFWTTLILFYPTVERVHASIFQPTVDTFPQIFPVLPPALQIDALRYGTRQVRDVAACVCRSLDFALNTTVQPDALAVPLHVVECFYRDLVASCGEGVFELMWCDGFRSRLSMKGQDIADVVASRNWHQLAQY